MREGKNTGSKYAVLHSEAVETHQGRLVVACEFIVHPGTIHDTMGEVMMPAMSRFANVTESTRAPKNRAGSSDLPLGHSSVKYKTRSDL